MGRGIPCGGACLALYARRPYIDTVAQSGTVKHIVHGKTQHGVNTLDLCRNGDGRGVTGRRGHMTSFHF